MTPLRILHVIPAVAPRYGGPSAAIVPMCEALNALGGVTADVATTDVDGAGAYDAAQWPARSTALRLFRVSRGTGARWAHSAPLARWLDEHVRSYDVVHVHSAWLHPTFAACRAARRHRVPVVYRPCGTLSPYTWARHRLMKAAYWVGFERSNVRSAAAFHCTSDDEAAELRLYRALKAPVVVQPLGVAPDAWAAPARAAALRERCGLPADGPPVVLFLSRVHPKKGVTDLLLPAFARLTRPATLVIAGGADGSAPDYPDEVARTAERLGLTARVRILGPIAPPDRWAVLDGAAVLALPSHQENFGLVVAEAMARGVPVVVSDQVQIAPHVVAAKAGAVVPRDVDALAAALDALLEHPAGRTATGARGREYARAVFDWAAVAARLRDLYRALTK
ncbi:glycosyltransferase [Gemmata sp. JC673]|uniref:Glycosyltransferase n=1 Tax=Gemmata algarum TaxID=2975278 RepID=A0ABU5ESA9_9BACT|nr:glycosyltransferase [Gemmata algarum]MDY3557839.1 glycosyltransferase [Gemmata algarum]